MGDELIFYFKYKSLYYNEKYDLENASKEQLAASLSKVSSFIEENAFSYTEINKRIIDDAISIGNGLKDIIKTLNLKSQSEWRRILLEACNGKEELISLAENYFISKLLRNNNIYIYHFSYSFPSLSTFSSNDEEIVFIGKYKDWVVIKKQSIDNKIEQKYIASILFSIQTTAVRKIFDFLNIGDEIKSSVEKITKNKRKSFSALIETLSKISTIQNITDIERNYMIKYSLENIGFFSHAHLIPLQEAYPDLKLPKPRGRLKI